MTVWFQSYDLMALIWIFWITLAITLQTVAKSQPKPSALGRKIIAGAIHGSILEQHLFNIFVNNLFLILNFGGNF